MEWMWLLSCQGGFETALARLLAHRMDQNGGSSDVTPGVAHGSLAGAPPWPPPAGAAPCAEGAGVAHGSLSAGEDWPPCCPPYDEPPCRCVRVTLAVAYFSDGPTSSTWISNTVRFSRSRVSYCRERRLPWTTTRIPFCSDSATFSAACRHTEQDKKSASPSFHSLAWRSKVRGVDAIRKLATAAPDGVKRSSGSSTRLPTTVIWVSPAMSGLLECERHVPAHRCPIVVEHTDIRQRCSTGCSVRGRPHHLGTEHRFVEAELAIELLDRRRLGGEIDDRVDALGVLADLVGQAAPPPHVDVLDAAAVLADDVEVLVERRLDRPLLEARVEDDHHFIGTHSGLHLLWTRAATDHPWQEGFALTCRHGVRRGSGTAVGQPGAETTGKG